MNAKYQVTEYGSLSSKLLCSKLSDLCVDKIGVQTGPFGSQLHKEDYVDIGTPIITVEHLGNNRISHVDTPFVTDEDKKRLSKYQLKNGDIVFSRVGSVDRRALVRKEEDGWLFSGRCIRIRVDKTKIDPVYLSYFFGLESFKKYIRSIAVGATMPSINTKILSDIPIYYPECLEEQKRIAHIFITNDEKANITNQTNQTLEQMAQAIFKSWFVDFDPVKAKMNGEQPEGMDAATASLFPEKLVSETGLPEGWKLSEIGDEVTVVGGGTPSKKNDDFWIDGHIHWTSPKDLSGVQDKVLLDTASKVTESGLKKISSGLLPVDTVLLSSRAPVGYLALAKVPMAINQGYIAMKCEKQLPPEFVLQWCVHRMDEIRQRASGSTFAEISKKSFKPISVVVPTGEVLSAYQKLVKPLYDAITSNARQNEQLSSLRDTLLPKLLSGEVNLTFDEVSE
ncbi:restriction endonuclease subunit S [Photobacterium damselae]|uniref:restriction endonuclease subunit S n=1 Tax=Photobacterium damselae TaxID=38293 RepID=UPI001EEDD2FA|nr:restriction endonuclease subunit S [Photobacterium damselae]UKA31766.1 restriction endonuclease subunit S [Photobacterium damselae subsp. damselae]